MDNIRYSTTDAKTLGTKSPTFKFKASYLANATAVPPAAEVPSVHCVCCSTSVMRLKATAGRSGHKRKTTIRTTSLFRTLVSLGGQDSWLHRAFVQMIDDELGNYHQRARDGCFEHPLIY